MKRISQDASLAFVAGMKFSRSNTSVTVDDNGVCSFSIFGNEIARIQDGELFITLACHNSVTTRERLNAILLTYYGTYELQVRNHQGTPYFEHFGESKQEVPNLYYPFTWGERAPWINTNDAINYSKSFDGTDEKFMPCVQTSYTKNEFSPKQW